MKTVFYYDGDIIKVMNYNAPIRYNGEEIILFNNKFIVSKVVKSNGLQKVYLV